MSDSLKAAAFAAGLSPEDQRKLDAFNKSLTVHKELFCQKKQPKILLINFHKINR